MSAIKDAIDAMKQVLLLNEKVDRVSTVLDKVTDELRDHDRRLVRLETIVEIGKARTRLPKK